MSGKKSKRTAFTLVIPATAAGVRKRFAPAGCAQEDLRRKKPRRRPDFIAEMDECPRAGRAAAEE
ncbi:MAG: hypothetical protein AUJ49_12155 [Desulfovibrionaceae bacterium CG1_02_65_16]|nr:MAG: hypothetical protein AUJ49_12155 [Desulfovibrionaceae bacterium CG1_02_65_16]